MITCGFIRNALHFSTAHVQMKHTKQQLFNDTPLAYTRPWDDIHVHVHNHQHQCTPPTLSL